MTTKPERLSSALDALRWRPAQLARYLRIDHRRVRRALDGETDLPSVVYDWLEYLAEPLRGTMPDLSEAADRLQMQPLPDGWHAHALPLERRERHERASESDLGG